MTTAAAVDAWLDEQGERVTPAGPTVRERVESITSCAAWRDGWDRIEAELWSASPGTPDWRMADLIEGERASLLAILVEDARTPRKRDSTRAVNEARAELRKAAAKLQRLEHEPTVADLLRAAGVTDSASAMAEDGDRGPIAAVAAATPLGGPRGALRALADALPDPNTTTRPNRAAACQRATERALRQWLEQRVPGLRDKWAVMGALLAAAGYDADTDRTTARELESRHRSVAN